MTGAWIALGAWVGATLLGTMVAALDQTHAFPQAFLSAIPVAGPFLWARAIPWSPAAADFIGGLYLLGLIQPVGLLLLGFGALRAATARTPPVLPQAVLLPGFAGVTLSGRF